jgi:hypothetical protein
MHPRPNTPSFDEWVAVAPFRHLGVFALIIIATVALVIA